MISGPHSLSHLLTVTEVLSSNYHLSHSFSWFNCSLTAVQIPSNFCAGALSPLASFYPTFLLTAGSPTRQPAQVLW